LVERREEERRRRTVFIKIYIGKNKKTEDPNDRKQDTTKLN